MRVLLINSPILKHLIARDMAGGLGFRTGESVVLPPLDLAYMAATLLDKGNEAKIMDFDAEDYDQKAFVSALNEYSPQAIIATVSLPTLYNDCQFLRELRRICQAQIIAKTGITYAPLLREVLEKSTADLCIFGECDLNIDRVILHEIRDGTAYFIDGKLIIERNMVIEDLDRLLLPARNLLPNDKYRYILLGDKVTAMQTSRGCPYPCSFYCPYPLVQGEKWRARSPEHVIREIEDIVASHKIKKIIFRDATFTLDRQRAERICDLITLKKLDIQWWCESRVDCLDKELMRKMKLAGCRGMNIGVETGSPEIMETRAKIGLTLEKLKAFRKSAKELNLQVHFLLMVGLPQETKKAVYQTYKLISALRPESFGVTIVTPYPGTPLYDQAKKKRWIETEDWNKYDGQSAVMHTDFLSRRQIAKLRRLIYTGLDLSRKDSFSGRVKSLFFNFYLKIWMA